MYHLHYAPDNHYPDHKDTPSYECTETSCRTSRADAAPRVAIARLAGGPLAPSIRGTITFREVPVGVMVCISVTGLPPYKPGTETTLPIGPHGFHIHQNGTCEVGDPSKPFIAAGEHWNPTNQPHGNHAGDFPVVFSNNGRAYMCFFTNKFRVSDVVGKAVIIHESPDDYKSQPAGNAGRRLACGVIQGS